MQPYQKASQAIQEQSKEPARIIGNAARTGASLAGFASGGAILKRILPFLSEHIPSDLAAKGIGKVDPRLGKFITGALGNGSTMQQALQFIKEKAENSQDQKKENPKQNLSIIQQYSDELDAFIKNHIQQGRQPLEAGALAQLDPKFKKVISKIEADHKTPFSAILESTYGSAQQPQQQVPQAPQTQNQSPDNNDQMLMAALEKILQM